MTTFIFTVALALGSFLLFSLEPMVAKSLLPALGGAPMVWNTCVVFFQATLLAGYAFAHFTAGASRRGAAALIAGGAMAAFTLPLALQDAMPVGAPAIWLISELARSVGPVFFVLSASAPALQVWFSKLETHRSRDPYFLYAASNAGSFVALLAYPTLIEPPLGLRTQQVGWSVAYVMFVALAAGCFLAVRNWSSETGTPSEESAQSPTRFQPDRWIWFGLAFVPSSLLLGVTTYISTDVTAVPLVWIVPLALYLLTFVIAFGGNAAGITTAAARRLPLMLCAVIFLVSAGIVLPITLNIVVHLAAFFLVAATAHGTLACRRPAVERLTEFYLIVSAGGVAAGLFNVFIAPLAFTAAMEYPLMLVAASLILRFHRPQPDSSLATDASAGAAAALATWLAITIVDRDGGFGRPGVVLVGLVTVAALAQARRPRRFTLILAGILLAFLAASRQYGNVLFAERTFFGTYRVSLTADGRYRDLYHGTTLHGRQATEPTLSQEPLGYYHRKGPFGEAYAAVPAMASSRNVAVVGLGVGSLGAYADANQHWTFFEIDPAVERIARDSRYFTFLRYCGDRCRVVIGDARLSLRLEADGFYDLLVIDAFSSDAIPMHLLTREAFQEYLARLSPQGVIAAHISNRYLDLRPVLAGIAESLGLAAFEQYGGLPEGSTAGPDDITNSHWVILARDAGTLERLRTRGPWTPLHTRNRRIVWTDEYSNILSVLGQ